MIVVNTETIPGHEVVELKGLVQGNTIRAKHVGRDIGAGLKNLVGGELKASRRPRSSSGAGSSGRSSMGSVP